MRPRNFQVAVAMRLGLPVLEEEKRCSLCMQIMDVFGDHAACCSVSSDRIHRHNRVRNLLGRIAQEGMLSPVMEKTRLLGDVYGRKQRSCHRRRCNVLSRVFEFTPQRAMRARTTRQITNTHITTKILKELLSSL